MNVRLRYFVRVTITRNYNTVVKEADFAVQNFQTVRDHWWPTACSLLMVVVTLLLFFFFFIISLFRLHSRLLPQRVQHNQLKWKSESKNVCTSSSSSIAKNTT